MRIIEPTPCDLRAYPHIVTYLSYPGEEETLQLTVSFDMTDPTAMEAYNDIQKNNFTVTAELFDGALVARGACAEASLEFHHQRSYYQCVFTLTRLPATLSANIAPLVGRKE